MQEFWVEAERTNLGDSRLAVRETISFPRRQSWSAWQVGDDLIGKFQNLNLIEDLDGNIGDYINTIR